MKKKEELISMTDAELEDIKKKVDVLNKEAEKVIEDNKRLLLFL